MGQWLYGLVSGLFTTCTSRSETAHADEPESGHDEQSWAGAGE